MNNWVSEVYGEKVASDEDQAKLAQAEFFAKLASDAGINLDACTNDQVAQLWDATFTADTKEASIGEQLAGAAKAVKGAAGSAVTRVKGVAGKAGTTAKETAGKAVNFVKEHPYATGGAAAGTAAAAGAGAYGLHRHNQKEASIEEAALQEFAEKRAAAEKLAEADVVGRAMAHSFVDELNKIGAAKAESEKEEEKEEEKGDKSTFVGKQASALDVQAATLAVKIAADAGFDADEAAALLTARLTLGVEDSFKCASASDPETGFQIRAMELLEAVGYPVTWTA